MIPLSWYLIVSALLFSLGLFGVLARRNAVAILMSVELMLNAVNIWHSGATRRLTRSPGSSGPSWF